MDGCLGIFMREDVAPSHEDVSTCSDEVSTSLSVDTAIDFDERTESTLVDHLP